MALALSHKIHKDYLEITTAGIRSRRKETSELQEIWKEVFVLAKENDHLRILAHLKEEGRWPLNAQINFGFKIVDTDITKKHRVAGICYSEQLFEDHELFIKYGRALGYNIQVFLSGDKARDWLLRDRINKPQVEQLNSGNES